MSQELPVVPLPRVPRVGFEAVPRHWFGGSRAATQIVNGLNLLFPAGERFFVRSVRAYLPQLSPDLVAQVKGFFGQEGRHAQAHERFFDILRAQGFDIDAILTPYERIAYGFIERWSPKKLRLSVTAACEHFTAILAEDLLVAHDLDEAHPSIRRLLEWHAVEELEHKAVAFDALKQIAPSYLLRMAGLLLATLTLGAFWLFATSRLLQQDGSSLRAAVRELRAIANLPQRQAQHQERAERSILTGVFGRGILEYMRPSFHPNDTDHSKLIAEALERLASEGVVVDAARGATPAEAA